MNARTGESKNGVVERLLWIVFAPFEFAVTVVVGVPLFLLRAVLIYLRALRGLFVRAAIVFVLRFRTGRIFHPTDKEEAPPPPISESIARGPVELGRFNSWLN